MNSSDANIATSSISGNVLTVRGTAGGTFNLSVCSTGGACAQLPVMVSGQAPGTTTSPLVVTYQVPTGSSVMFNLTGGNNTFTLGSMTSGLARATLNGSTLTLEGTAMGSGNVQVCSVNGCTPLYFSVIGGTGGRFIFNNNLAMGMSGEDVQELQLRLKDEGYFTSNVTGYYGPITQAAVRSYQQAKGISAVGLVGPMTRAQLNSQ